MKKYAILFRTHYWTEYLEKRMDELKEMAPLADIYICYDATNSSPPDIQGIAPHSLESLSNLGLYIPQNKALWYCGDYPFYDFYSKYPNYELYLMIENDVYIRGLNIDLAIEKIINGPVGILGAHFSLIDRLSPSEVFSKGREMYDVWRKCFFPIVGLKRSTLVSLFGERLRQSELKNKDASFEIPFCETYVGSHTYKIGVPHQELGDLLPMRVYGASRYMLYEKIVSEGREGIWHSVFPVEQYLNAKISQEYEQKREGSFFEDGIIDDLTDALKYAKISISDIETKLHLSTEGKINRDTYKSRIDNLVIPALKKFN